MQKLGSLQPLALLPALLKEWGISVSPVMFTGQLLASTTINNVTKIDELAVGMIIEGPGIPPGTTITSIGTGNTLTMSAATTASGMAQPLEASFPSTAEIHLAAAPLTMIEQPLPSDFTEATFDTYSSLFVATLFGPYLLPDGSAQVDCTDPGWVLSAPPVTPNTIYGYWIDYVPVGGGSRVVALWESFNAPQPMSVIGNAVVFNLPFLYPGVGSATLIS